MKNRVEARETSRDKVRESVGLSAPMNKISPPTYISKEKESLIVSDANIGGGHGPPLAIISLLEQLHRIIKSVKCQSSDNDIVKNAIPQVFTPIRQA